MAENVLRKKQVKAVKWQARCGCVTPSQPRIHRRTLQGQDAEGAFVDAVKRFVGDEAVQGLHAQGVFPQGQGAFRGQGSPGEGVPIGRAGCIPGRR